MAPKKGSSNGNTGSKPTPKPSTDFYEIPKPPDGGWGWMVVIGSFIVHVIADGVAYSFGVVMVELLDQFDAGRAEFGLIGAIMVGLTMGVGPIASMMESRWGCRVVTIIGTFICSFGFFISIFAPNVYFMYVSFGIIGGTGFGIIYLPAITCVSYYFEKKRAFATGLAVCGSGMGTFLLAPFINWCLDEYGWKGTVLIESGLLLNCAVSGMLFRPLEAPRHKNTPVSASESGKPLLSAKGVPADVSCSDTGIHLTRVTELKRIVSSEHSSVRASDAERATASASDLRHRGGARHDSESGSVHSAGSKHLHPHVTHRKDAFYNASLENIALYRSNPDMYTASMTRLNTQHDDVDLPEDDSNPCPCCICLTLEKRRGLNKSMDLSLFTDVFFELFAWSNFLTNFTFFIPFMFLPDRAVNLGESEKKGAMLVSVIGIFNTLGRIIFGFVSDRIPNMRLYLYNTSLTLCGIVTCLSAFFPAYPFLAGYAAAYGLLVGVYVTLTPVIIVDLLGLEKLSNAFGWVLMFQGIATGLGPPIAGKCFDLTGDYTVALWLFGIMMALSGIMLYPIPCIGRLLGKPWTLQQQQGEIVANKDVSSAGDYKAVPQITTEQV